MGYLHAVAPEIIPCGVICIGKELTVLSTGRRRSGGKPKRSGADDTRGMFLGKVQWTEYVSKITMGRCGDWVSFVGNSIKRNVSN